MENIFTQLTLALGKTPAVALFASLGWGVISILLSPCHLASIPLIVAFVGAQGEKLTLKRAFFISLLFSSGILVTIAVIGAITGFAGMMIGNIGPWGNVLVAAVFLVIGFYLLGIIPLPFLENAVQPGYEKKGYWAAFVLGLVFGLALGPCTFAFMAPMLAVAFNEASKNPVYSMALVAAYALGHCGVIVVAGTFTEAVEKYLKWGEESKAVAVLKKICGALILAAAVYLVLTARF